MPQRCPKPAAAADLVAAAERNQQKRRLLFRSSWDSKVLPAKLKPDIDFQLNPWTLYSLVHPNFNINLVSVSFSFDEIVFSHSFLFTEWCSVLSAMDGLSSILSLWEKDKKDKDPRILHLALLL